MGKTKIELNTFELNLIYKSLTRRQMEIQNLINNNPYMECDLLNPLISESNHINNLLISIWECEN